MTSGTGENHAIPGHADQRCAICSLASGVHTLISAMNASTPGRQARPTRRDQRCSAPSVFMTSQVAPGSTQPANDSATSFAVRLGVTASDVRSTPWTTHGWRPTSVVVQPASTATRPSGSVRDAARRHAFDANSRPRQASRRPQATTPSITMPIPTITRNAQQTIATGGRSSGGRSLRPCTSPFQSCVGYRLASLGIAISKRLRWPRRATRSPTSASPCSRSRSGAAAASARPPRARRTRWPRRTRWRCASAGTGSSG